MRWCLLFSAALLPFFILPVPWVSVAQSKVLLLATLVFVAFASWLFMRLTESSLSVPKNVLLLSVSFLPVAYMVSAFASGGSIASFVSGSAEQDTVVIVCILYVYLALIGLTFSSGLPSLVRIARAFLGGALVLTIFQLLRLIVPDWLTLGGALQGSASSIVGSWHDLGIVAGLTVFLSSALFQTPVSAGRVWKWVVGALGASSFLVLFFVNTLDVWYVLTATILFYVTYRCYSLYMREQMPLRATFSRMGAWLALLVVMSVSLVGSGPLHSRLPSQLQIAQFEVRPSWQGTFTIGEKVLSGKSGLIFGSGPNTFVHEWGRFKPAGVNATNFWNVDFPQGVGIVPTAFVTVGILGAVAWLLPVLGLLSSLVRFLRDRRSYALPLKMVTGAILFAALYLMTFLVIYVPGITVVALAFLILGMLIAAEMLGSEGKTFVLPLGWGSWKSLVGLMALLVVSAAVLFACVTALRATLSDVYLGRASAYAASGDISRAGSLVGKALLIFPQNDNAERAAVQVGLARFSELAASGKTDDAARSLLQKTFSETIKHGLAAVSINGRDYQNWLSLAALYQSLAGVGVQGAFENAKGAYEKAIAENPTNPLLYTLFAQLEMAQNEPDLALKNLDASLQLKRDLPVAYFFRSQIEASQKNFPAAESDAIAVTTLASEDPLGWYNLGAIYYAAGSYPEASAPLERALALQSNYANAMYVLALTYDKLGRAKEALAMMEKLEELNPGNATVARIIKNLKDGKPALSGVPSVQ